MNRAQALEYLTSEYSDLYTESNLDADAMLRAYGNVIDQSLRILGYHESDLASADETEEVVEYTALLDYFALLRYSKVFAVRSDVSVSGAISASQSQAYAQVKQLLDMAQVRLSGLGISPTESMQVGRFNLDFLEPDWLAEGVG